MHLSLRVLQHSDGIVVSNPLEGNVVHLGGEEANGGHSSGR